MLRLSPDNGQINPEKSEEYYSRRNLLAQQFEQERNYFKSLWHSDSSSKKNVVSKVTADFFVKMIDEDFLIYQNEYDFITDLFAWFFTLYNIVEDEEIQAALTNDVIVAINRYLKSSVYLSSEGLERKLRMMNSTGSLLH